MMTSAIVRVAALHVLVLFLAAGASAQTSAPSEPERIDALLAPFLQKHGMPALGGAIVSGSRTVALGAAGVRRAGGEEAVTVEDRWHLGSCTKSMTATLIGRFVERSKIGWDLPLARAFPDLADTMTEAYRPVSLELLLRHRGGIPSDLSAGGLWARLWKRNGTPEAQRRDLVETLLRGAPTHDPGTRYLYSNAGYAMAGAALERAEQKSWEDLMRAELFEPLGMSSAGFGAPGDPDSVDQPHGHGADGKPVAPGPNADNPPAIGPGGTVHASLGDWAKYVSLHLAGARGQSGLLLQPETFTKLHTPLEGQDYALGWAIGRRDWAGGRVLTHSGSNTMWFCVVWIAPERDFAVLATCNRGGDAAARACDEAVSALIRHHTRRTRTPESAPAR